MFLADLSHLLKEPLMESFLFCAVITLVQKGFSCCGIFYQIGGHLVTLSTGLHKVFLLKRKLGLLNRLS